MQLPGEFSPFIEKKVVFCLVVGGVTPLLVVRPLKKKHFFYVCLPLENIPFSWRRFLSGFFGVNNLSPFGCGFLKYFWDTLFNILNRL